MCRFVCFMLMTDMISLLGITFLLTGASCRPSLIEIETVSVATLFNITQEVATMDCSNVDDQNAGSNIRYTLYNQKNQLNGIVLNNTNLNQINPLLRVTLIIHGWLLDSSQPWFVQMKDIYLNKSPVNIIIVDWSTYSELNYGESVCDVPYVGQSIGDFIYNLTTAGITQLGNVQINAYSLGAHVAGFAGKRVQNRTGGSKIPRIVGLDAAGPGFEDRDPNQRLASTDALCVQAVHTSGGTFGYKSAYGTIDFQCNYDFLGCGVVQRGCPFFPGVPVNSILPYVFCDHIRAIAYFNEAINSRSFIGVKCSNCSEFGSGRCTSTSTAVMGENFPCNASGEHYLSTNSNSPFARGLSGTRP